MTIDNELPTDLRVAVLKLAALGESDDSKDSQQVSTWFEHITWDSCKEMSGVIPFIQSNATVAYHTIQMVYARQAGREVYVEKHNQATESGQVHSLVLFKSRTRLSNSLPILFYIRCETPTVIMQWH